MERIMNATDNDQQFRGKNHPAKPEQIMNNPGGGSTVTFPDGTGGDTASVTETFSGENGHGMLLEKITTFKDGTSQLVDSNPADFASIGEVGSLFGAGDVASELKSVTVNFSGPNASGSNAPSVTSGIVDTTNGESYKFSLNNLPTDEFLSVQEFSKSGGNGKLEETITLNKDGSAEIKTLGGHDSGLPKGVLSSEEIFNMQGMLTTIQNQLSNGRTQVDTFNYNSSGMEVSETMQTLSRSGRVVSSSTVAPSGQPLPSFGGPATVAALTMALAGFSPAAAGASSGTSAVSAMPQHKVTLAPSAH
jgi:hypothetical protein